MTFWLKLGYFTGSRDDPRYWRTEVTWVSDSPGRASPRWKHRRRPRQGDVRPPFGPRYEIGDRLVMYLTQVGRCPAILEVTREPYWDPARVDAEAAPGEGDSWGVVTEVAPVDAIQLSAAPALEDLGVRASAISQHGHIVLEDWQYAEAERLITRADGRRPPSPPRRHRHSHVPLEEGDREGYEVATRELVRRAVRRESKLVHDYAEHMRAHGDTVLRDKIAVAGTGANLYSDVFNVTRGHLIEAKASSDRGDIRMALGQLADYRRFISPPPKCAILLEAKPHPDLLDLLATERIVAIWRQRDGFADTALGAFTERTVTS